MKTILATEKGTCYLCRHIGYTEAHHIFGGADRKKSEQYGLKVYLCPECHRNGTSAAHRDPKTAELLHKEGQEAFEQTHTREEFMRVFGKNYL